MNYMMFKTINIKSKQAIASIIAFLVVIALIFLLKGDSEFTDNAYLKADIVIIRPKVSGYITEISVADNQLVKTGQIIAKIDDRDYKLKVDAATAKVNSLLQKLDVQELEITNAELKQNSAKVSFEVADSDFKRAIILVKDKAISQQDFDKKRDLQNSLKNEYASADSNYKSALLKKEINLSELNESRANLELAKIDLENTVIKAAVDGTVSRRSLQVGQLASPAVALAYLVSNNTWVLANFKETQIGKMKPGQEAIVTVDSFKKQKFKARIDSLSPATGAEFSILPPENATGNFTKIVQRVPVKIIFDSSQDLSLLKSGLSCEVKVELE